MAYGYFTGTLGDYLRTVSFTVTNGASNEKKTYSNIKIFRTTSSEMVTPCVRTNGNTQTLSDMNPNGISGKAVIAKTNAAPLGGGNSFYGIYYVAGQLYISGYATSTAGIPTLPANTYPAFCLKKDGSVNIRWFKDGNDVAKALIHCRCIIGAAHPLVYKGLSVLEDDIVYDEYTDRRIADWNNLTNPNYHFNDDICNGQAKIERPRTMFGYNPVQDKYYLVCTNSGMNLRVGAKLMHDLGCEFAVNMDGGSATQMRVASGYTNGAAAGRVTSVAPDSYLYGTAICVHKK